MYYFYYLAPDNGVIRIRTKRRPGLNTCVRGTWIVQEQGMHDSSTIDKHGNVERLVTWQIGAFPEITWAQLSKFKYIGKLESRPCL